MQRNNNKGVHMRQISGQKSATNVLHLNRLSLRALIFGIALILLLPSISLALGATPGFNFHWQAFQENPSEGVTYEDSSPNGYGLAATPGGGHLQWRVRTYELDDPRDVYHFFYTDHPYLQTGWHFITPGGSLSWERPVAYKINTSFVDYNVYMISDFTSLFPDNLIGVGCTAFVAPGQNFLHFNDVTIWCASVNKGQGACYDNSNCSGRPLRRPTTKSQCEAMDGSSWEDDQGVCHVIN